MRSVKAEVAALSLALQPASCAQLLSLKYLNSPSTSMADSNGPCGPLLVSYERRELR